MRCALEIGERRSDTSWHQELSGLCHWPRYRVLKIQLGYNGVAPKTLGESVGNFLKGYFNPTVYERYDSTRSVFNCYLGIHGVFNKDDSDNVVIEGEAVGSACEGNNILFLYIKMEEPVFEEFITAQ